MTGRTKLWDVLIVGGPCDGLRMQVRDRGETVLDGAAVFFPDGLDGYRLDREARTLTLEEDS